MLVNYCENLKMKNGYMFCKINGKTLRCKCVCQIELHKEKWKR